MKALVYQAPQQLDFSDVAPPEPQNETELLVHIDSVGICGSDLHAYLGHDERRPPPLVLGHEAAGVIAQGPRASERVTINPLVSCGQCPACVNQLDNLCPQRQIISMPPRPGAFAQQVVIPASNVLSVPARISLTQAALAEPLACGWHAVQLAQRAVATGNDTLKCLVIGGGAIGLGVALCLRAQGFSSISLLEKNPLRRQFLQQHCPGQVISELDRNSYYDLLIDAVGIAASRQLACARAYPGASVVHIGLGSADGGIDVRRLTLQQISFIGSYTYSQQDFRACAQALFAGALGDLGWIEIRQLSSGAQAFADLVAGKVAAPKIILKP